ncbi:MAG: hypothetical protein HY983_04440 [Candidatus Magasanikbacteria bacterium]|nr:hypothetical protein [Candidatus Magasanikbacteria bacterium]
MPKNKLDTVEIVEPPLGELTKKRSSFKRTCLTGCGCLLLFLIGAVVAFRIAVGTGPTTLGAVPKNFPESIPIYDKDTIDRITFISGRYKNRSMEIAAFFPKVILSSLLLTVQHDEQPKSPSGNTAAIPLTRRFWSILTAPVGDARDTVQIEWKNMDAEPGFVSSYYKKELLKKGYTIDEEKENKGTHTFSFSQGTTNGALLTQGEEEKRPGTDYAVLTVNFGSAAPSTK